MRCIGRETIVGLAAVQTLTPPAGIRVHETWVQALTQNVRYTLQGTDPTAALGQVLYAGHPPTILAGEALPVAFEAIEEAVGATLEVIYFG